MTVSWYRHDYEEAISNTSELPKKKMCTQAKHSVGSNTESMTR